MRQPALHSEEEVQNLRYPAMLLDPHHTQNVILVVEIYPQIGNQAIRYDLHVENENGRPMNVPRNAWIYLPYPEGGGPDDNMEYLLQHFNANEQGIGYEKLTKEKQGLRFKPKSLSPFLLSWSRSGDAPAEPEENPTPTVVPTVVPTVAPTPELPRTGDDSHPALLLAAMALALTLMIGLQRKQRRS